MSSIIVTFKEEEEKEEEEEEVQLVNSTTGPREEPRKYVNPREFRWSIQYIVNIRVSCYSLFPNSVPYVMIC